LDHFLHQTPKLGIPVEMVQFLLKLLLKQISCSVLPFQLILTAKFQFLYVKESESEILDSRSRESESEILESRSRVFSSDSATLAGPRYRISPVALVYMTTKATSLLLAVHEHNIKTVLITFCYCERLFGIKFLLVGEHTVV